MKLPRLCAVGRIRSPHRSPRDVPPGGARADAVIAARYASALRGIEDGSHVLLLALLDRARRGALTVDRLGPEGVRRLGVFATRCPSRPNPVGVTVARLLGRRGRTLHLDGVDLADGTPLLDVKPYLPGADAVFSARRSAGRSRARLPPADLLGFLERDLSNHLGDEARRTPARAALLAVARAARTLGVEPRDPALRVTVSRGGLAADALMGLLGATLASGRVRVAPSRGPLLFRFRVGRRRLACGPAGEVAAGSHVRGTAPGTPPGGFATTGGASRY